MHNEGWKYWGLSTALGGAMWANHNAKCKVCSAPPKLGFIDSKTLSSLGIVTYALLLGGLSYNSSWLSPLIQITSAAQLILMGRMIRTGKICPACSLTALGALMAASATFSSHK